MSIRLNNHFMAPILALIGLCAASCSKSEEPMRMPDDILGIWALSDTEYFEFSTNNIVHQLEITFQDEESIGVWNDDVFLYEPGYNLVVYLNYLHEMKVYEIISLTDNELTWCWVEDVDYEGADRDSLGQMIGGIINQAQEGFYLDPELYQTFKKVPRNQFLEMLESLDIMYPWF